MIQRIIETIKNPSSDARGYTRWWWYGCAVTREGIERQLLIMKNAGIGGVEIQILYSITQDDPEKGIRNIPYFSPDFFEIVDFTCKKCAELDMKLDFTLGSSWPYGGPFVPLELAMQSAIPYQIDVHGPCEFNCDLTTRIVGDVCAAVMGRMQNCIMLPETMIDITDKFTTKNLFCWPWGTQIEMIHIPEGDWKIVFFVIYKYRQMVGKPAPNGEGYVIDHCNHKAADCFFDNMAQPIVDRIGTDAINSFFCDSIECDGHNWSGVLLEEFQKRRGYDLRSYIYALWGEVGSITPNIRYDYFLTMSELTIENFFEQFTQWCNKNGSLSRTQVHGTWGDILKAYATADIPEGETFGEHDKLECNTIHRRLAASAGHLYGRNIISNETFTWLKVPRFIETLEHMKASVDAVFLDGMNMIVNHGFPYSPESTAERGWPFYASSHICDSNPWWPYYKHLARYIQTVSAVLRRGHHYAEVGIYLPQADVWSDNVLSDLHMAMKLEEYIGRDVADDINKAGYWFDYINDDALTRLGKICDGGIHIGENVYKVILLIECTRLPENTAEVMQRFVQNGGTLIAADKRPFLGCGLVDREKKDESVNQITASLFKQKGWNYAGAGRTIITPDRRAGLIKALRDSIRPDVSIDCSKVVGYVHRIEDDSHIYFTSNISSQACRCTLTFKDRISGFKIMNPETGDERKAAAFEKNTEGMTIVLDYQAYEAVFIVFSSELELKDVLCSTSPVKKLQLELVDWTLKVPAISFEKKMRTLSTWEKFADMTYYSGEGVYECAFFCEEDTLKYRNVILEIDNIYCAAEVWVNELKCGDIWKAPYAIKIGEALVKGLNSICIKVVNTLINEAINPLYSEELNPVVIDQWPYFGNTINDIRKKRYFYGKERMQVTTPRPSGLFGKAVVTFFE